MHRLSFYYIFCQQILDKASLIQNDTLWQHWVTSYVTHHPFFLSRGLALIVTIVLYKRMVPFKLPEHPDLPSDISSVSDVGDGRGDYERRGSVLSTLTL